MRIREILWEDYNAQLSSDLDNLLVSAKATGVRQIETPVLVSLLQSMGYSIDTDSLLSFAQDNPIVQNATPETIDIFEPGYSDFDTQDNGEDSEQQVDKMAQTAAAKGINQ